LTEKENNPLHATPHILLFGYGNPGRQDDGLGNAFVEDLEEWLKKQDFPNIEVDSNYQLNIEDADTISRKDIVIFIDASVEEIEDFLLTRVEASDSKIEFTLHAVSAAFILDLCHKLYNRYPETYLLHIKGYEWELREGLTGPASRNLEAALDFIKANLATPEKFRTFAQ
jgi:hydrogenase maturation protease